VYQSWLTITDWPESAAVGGDVDEDSDAEEEIEQAVGV